MCPVTGRSKQTTTHTMYHPIVNRVRWWWQATGFINVLEKAADILRQYTTNNKWSKSAILGVPRMLADSQIRLQDNKTRNADTHIVLFAKSSYWWWQWCRCWYGYRCMDATTTDSIFKSAVEDIMPMSVAARSSWSTSDMRYNVLIHRFATYSQRSRSLPARTSK